jgi:ABC-type Fe3+/spermidine/putrescine transport system ATPase subunit
MSGFLDLVGVEKRFGDTTVLHGIDLEVAKGEFVSLIGPSGSGKTTTLRIITGSDQPTSGAVRLEGQDITFVPPHKRGFAMVFQHFALFPHKNVYDNVAYGLQLRKVAKAQVDERVLTMLDRVNMREYAKRKVHELSGGQRQRVAIARALVIEPRLVLLDEPTGSLDAKLRLRMQTQLKELHRELGLTFIHVTHNQSEALALADRVFVMNDGRVEQSGPPADVFNAPATRFVAEFVGRNNLLDGTVEGSTFVSPVGRFALNGRAERERLHGSCTAVIRADSLRLGEPEGGGPSVTARLQALEYGGSFVTWFLSAHGTQLQLDLRAEESGAQGPAIGSDYSVWWQPEDAHYLCNEPINDPSTDSGGETA